MMRTLVILAGGKSSRMGRDKTFLQYKDKSFLEHLIQKAEGYFEEVVVSTGSKQHTAELETYIKKIKSSLPISTVPDKYPGIGPMGGLLSVFEQGSRDSFAVIAVDVPDCDMKELSKLLEILKQTDNAAVMLRSAGKAEPCAAAYGKEAYELLKMAYDKGEFGLLRAIGNRIAYVDSFEKDLNNINTPYDYEKLIFG